MSRRDTMGGSEQSLWAQQVMCMLSSWPGCLAYTSTSGAVWGPMGPGARGIGGHWASDNGGRSSISSSRGGSSHSPERKDSLCMGAVMGPVVRGNLALLSTEPVPAAWAQILTLA